MALFGKRKKEGQDSACCCAEDCAAKAGESGAGARVKILGSGCAKCNALEKAAKEALGELNMDARVEHVTDFAKIAAYGVMTTPALVVDEKVVSFGRVLSTDEVKEILEKTL